MAQLVARLVRNEKVGGSNPPSSTTGRHPIRMSVFCMPGRCCGGALLWRRWCSGRRRARLWGRAAVCAGGRRPARSPSAPRAAHAVCCCLWRRWCSGRRRARPPARSPHASLKARSGRSRSPPVPSGPSGALHTGGACVAWTSPTRPRCCPRAPRQCPPVPPVPSTPAACAVLCVVARRFEAWPHCCRSPVRPATHVKPSSPLLARALSLVKPMAPLRARYTRFRRYFGAQRRRGFHTGVLRLPHWC